MRGLIDALQPGQTIVHGQCPTVGAGGLFLHGGYHTTLTLKYGRGNDTVTAMEVVIRDEGALEDDVDVEEFGEEDKKARSRRVAAQMVEILTETTKEILQARHEEMKKVEGERDCAVAG